jgi:hypothetical protein
MEDLPATQRLIEIEVRRRQLEEPLLRHWMK